MYVPSNADNLHQAEASAPLKNDTVAPIIEHIFIPRNKILEKLYHHPHDVADRVRKPWRRIFWDGGRRSARRRSGRLFIDHRRDLRSLFGANRSRGGALLSLGRGSRVAGCFHVVRCSARDSGTCRVVILESIITTVRLWKQLEPCIVYAVGRCVDSSTGLESVPCAGIVALAVVHQQGSGWIVV